MLTIKCIRWFGFQVYTIIPFSVSQGKRITVFILILIHSDLLFYKVFTKRIKAKNGVLQQFRKFRKEIKTSL